MSDFDTMEQTLPVGELKLAVLDSCADLGRTVDRHIAEMRRTSPSGMRHASARGYLKDSYILTPDKLRNAREDLCIMHPLPRVNEISVAIDNDPRACYFKQVLYGKYMRMALILKLLKEAGTI